MKFLMERWAELDNQQANSSINRTATELCTTEARLDHEVLDGAMEGRVVVVACRGGVQGTRCCDQACIGNSRLTRRQGRWKGVSL
jgi:hypothetical protein